MHHSRKEQFIVRPSRRVVACVVGTRPEVIKMAPVISRLKETDWADVRVISTGQQDGLLSDMLADFGLKPDGEIVHQPCNTTPIALHGTISAELDKLFEVLNPACVVAQGDTTTVFTASIASFYRKVPFVHVEAGLRTNDVLAPFPEEYHRRVIAVGTALHCAPTPSARDNLLRENIPSEKIIVSGNTVIDALLETAAVKLAPPPDFPAGRVILMTAHRRENFGKPLRDAFAGIRAFLDIHTDVGVYFPVHPNPKAADVANEILSGHPRVRLVQPLSYRNMVAALQHCWCVVTDSGGLQEEAPAIGKPVLVMRDVTERPEAVDAGVVEIVGTGRLSVFDALACLHRDSNKYQRMARPVFPYGDGKAGKRIADAIRANFVGTEGASCEIDLPDIRLGEQR
jgi:UDP-N-acetylglucosamine 2-epimerase (non-hydrolysing)